MGYGNKMRKKKWIAGFISLFIFCPCVVFSATFYADDDICPQSGSGTNEDPFCSIQSGINAATAGDIVLVAPGTYLESIDFLGKAITVRSDADLDRATYDISPDTTIIFGAQTGPTVSFRTYEPKAALVDGLTIYNIFDGGIYCSESSPTITNCKIIGENGNSTRGGIYCSESSPTITNCIITENFASDTPGGGIDCRNSSPTIRNCRISENSTSGVGGGISLHNSSLTITNCKIFANIAGTFGGGIYCSKSSDPIIEACSITENSARQGGGIYCYYHSDATIANCMISDNSAENGSGGGVYCFYSDPTIINCLIIGNYAESYGGGIYCFDHSSPLITNCTISDNIAPQVGGIYCYTDSSAIVTNSIVWGNSDVQTNCDCDGRITYSDIGDACPGEGNINVNPLFVGGGNYHLHCGLSPCVNAGTRDVPELWETDFEDNPRICYSTVDIGIYECCDMFRLELDAEYEEGYIYLDYVLGSLRDVLWINYLILTSPTIEIIELWRYELGVIDPPLSIPVSFPLSELGWIWIYTTFFTPEGRQIDAGVLLDTDN